MLVYVGGIPGTGKTTIIRRSIELAKRINFPLQGLEEKKLLCQITSVSSAEEYARLPAGTRAQARKQMVDHFYEIDEKDPATIRIRDDHFTAPNKNGVYWVRPLAARDKLHMIAFVVIMAEPNNVFRRRLDREFLYLEPKFLEFNKIIQHQEMEVKIASRQAEHLNIPFKIIENKDGEIEETSEILLSFIKETIKRG